MSNKPDPGKNANIAFGPFSKSSRKFIVSTIAGLGAVTLTASLTALAFMETKKIRAIAFDAFPVFDTRPIFKLIEKMFLKREFI